MQYTDSGRTTWHGFWWHWLKRSAWAEVCVQTWTAPARRVRPSRRPWSRLPRCHVGPFLMSVKLIKSSSLLTKISLILASISLNLYFLFKFWLRFVSKSKILSCLYMLIRTINDFNLWLVMAILLNGEVLAEESIRHTIPYETYNSIWLCASQIFLGLALHLETKQATFNIFSNYILIKKFINAKSFE